MRLRLETPYLVMDLAAVEQQYRMLANAIPGIHPHYAMKCNPDIGVLQKLHDLGSSFEIASATELDILREIGINGADVIFSNPVKSPQDIERAIGGGVWRFAVDSTDEIDKLRKYGSTASAIIRIAVNAGESDVPSEGKFGIDIESARKLALDIKRRGMNVYGIAFHVGSQMIDPTAWTRAIADAGKLMRALYNDEIIVSALNIGGGFPARYSRNIPALDVYGREITNAVAKHVPYSVDLICEPGRALVANAGHIVATVIGTAQRNGKRWVHLDIGAFNGMMEALETNNELRYPMRDSRNSKTTELFHVTGPSCDSQDTILFDVALSQELSVGDTVIIDAAGAYTTSYASTFNGFKIPPTVCV